MSQSAQPTRTKRLTLNSFALYLMSLAAMITLYAVYAKFLVPILEGPRNVIKRRIVAPNVNPPSSHFDKSELTRLLPSDAWEHGDCKTLLTPQGTILFQNFERASGKFIDVFPFTLVAAGVASEKTDDQPNDPITVLRCVRRARLKFDRPIAEAFAGKAKLDFAQLEGQVEIFRPPTSATSEDGLSITTSNVQIEKQRVFTIEQVQFAYGRNRGSGRNLSIELAHDSNVNEITGDFSSIRGVKRIELAYLDQMRFEPATTNSLVSDSTGDSVAANVSANDNSGLSTSKMDGPIVVNCDGPFVFDLETKTATLRENVVVEMENEYRDNIRCSQLEIFFRKQRSSKTPPPIARGKNAGEEFSDLTLHQIVAIGTPAIIFSPQRAAKVESGTIRYNATLQRMVAEQSQDFKEPVVIVSPDYHLVAERITYQLMEDGSLGAVDALGPGKMLQVASENQKEFFLQWQGELAVRPKGSEKIISLLGGTKIRFDGDTHVEAGRLDLWLNQIQVVKSEGDGKTKKSWDYQPKRLVAKSNVQITSPQLDGKTERLVAVWEQNPTKLQSRRLNPLESRYQLAAGAANTAISYRPSYEFPQNVPQQDRWAETSNAAANEPAFQPIRRDRRLAQVRFDEEVPRPKKKFAFEGDRVEVKLANEQDKTSVRNLLVQGNILIQEISPPDSVQGPVVIKGDSLRLIPQTENMLRMLVAGTPQQLASVNANSLQLQGQNIHLDQQANKLWVEGVGRIYIENDPTLQRPNLDQPPSDPAFGQFNFDKVSVSWLGGMIFDGSNIYFENDVEMSSQGKNQKAQGTLTNSSSEGLSLKLSKPVDFQNFESDQTMDDVEITELVIVDRLPNEERVFQLAKASQDPPIVSSPRPAVIANQTLDADGSLIEKQELRVPQATMDSGSGTFNARGPGVILQYRKGQVELLPSNSARSELQDDTTKNAEVLTLVRVNFDGLASADVNQKELIIRGNVRTLYAPIKSFDEIPDPDLLQQLPDESVKITCDQLQLAEWSPRNAKKPTKELIATGNAHIVSNSFEAIANRVSYNEASDILVVEGSPRSDARLSFAQTPNSRKQMVAGKILYRISDKWAEAQGVKNINIESK